MEDYCPCGEPPVRCHDCWKECAQVSTDQSYQAVPGRANVPKNAKTSPTPRYLLHGFSGGFSGSIKSCLQSPEKRPNAFQQPALPEERSHSTHYSERTEIRPLCKARNPPTCWASMAFRNPPNGSSPLASRSRDQNTRHLPPLGSKPSCHTPIDLCGKAKRTCQQA